MILLINKDINKKKGVTVLKNSSGEIQWLKLCKSFFGLNKDMYVCFVYMPPSNSSYVVRHNLEVMNMLTSDVLKYGQLGNLVICGDLNARTASESENVNSDYYIPLPNDNVSYNLSPRFSNDSVYNERGKDLIDFCISTDVQILNGRTFGDFSGKFTYFQYNGNSAGFQFICQ
jgi:hypothetical protein